MQKKRYQYFKALLVTFGVLVVSLIAVLILMLTGTALNANERQGKFIETARFLSGITVGGVDVSGKSYEEALADERILAAARAFEESFTCSFNVINTTHTFTAAELGLAVNTENVLKEALCFGQHGEGDLVASQKRRLEEGNVNIDFYVYGDEFTVTSGILDLKPVIDTVPQDARFEIADNIRGNTDAKCLEDIEGVTIVQESVGADVDAIELAKLICGNINNGDYAAVADAPVHITNPQVDTQTLKANTVKRGEMTSLFNVKPLNNSKRVKNIKIFANIINGSILNPGDIWSLNEAAGPRNEKTAKTVGWEYAPGISNGRYEDQLGGGVCQISSTVYNAALRAEMTIVQRRPHSWPSSYVPEGLDATISTGGPDLVISNPTDSPIYMVACVDDEEYKLTVQLFGAPQPHGFTIDFISELVRTGKAPEPVYNYNSAATPDGEPIGEGKTVTWIKPRGSQTWRIYKQYKDADGVVIKTEVYGKDVTYGAYGGVYYINGPDPSLAPSAPVTGQD